MTTDNLSEKEIREEIAKIEARLRAGDATPADANRIGQLRRALASIRDARENHSKTW